MFTSRESSSQPWTPAHLQVTSSMCLSPGGGGAGFKHSLSCFFLYSVGVYKPDSPFHAHYNFFSLNHVFFFFWCVYIHVCTSMCMCVRIWACRYMNPCVHVCGGQIATSTVISQGPFTLFLQQGLSVAWNPPRISWLAGGYQKSCIYLPSVGNASARSTSGFVFPERTQVLKFAIKCFTDWASSKSRVLPLPHIIRLPLRLRA